MKVVKRMVAGLLVAVMSFGVAPTVEPDLKTPSPLSLSWQRCLDSDVTANIIDKSAQNYPEPEKVTPGYICYLLKTQVPDYYQELFGPKPEAVLV